MELSLSEYRKLWLTLRNANNKLVLCGITSKSEYHGVLQRQLLMWSRRTEKALQANLYAQNTTMLRVIAADMIVQLKNIATHAVVSTIPKVKCMELNNGRMVVPPSSSFELCTIVNSDTNDPFTENPFVVFFKDLHFPSDMVNNIHTIITKNSYMKDRFGVEYLEWLDEMPNTAFEIIRHFNEQYISNRISKNAILAKNKQLVDMFKVMLPTIPGVSEEMRQAVLEKLK